MEPFLLPAELNLPVAARARLARLYESSPLADPAARPETVALEEFGVDVSGRYGPLPIRHPFGKASGQLSLQVRQVETDVAAGLAFVVLKTVIAEDEIGGASMAAWKIREPRMIVEPIEGRRAAQCAPRRGWTVSWAGRGWEGSLQSYLEFTAEALAAASGTSSDAPMPVIPSVKYHLPGGPGQPFREEEYAWTTARLLDVWDRAARAGHVGPNMVLEQDFSPTLAGADLAGSRAMILNWLDKCPALIKAAAPECVLGVKVMNAIFEDDFQLEMLRTLGGVANQTDFMVCFNRLFDPGRAFGEKRGIAYGGPDLSDRNLGALRRAILESAVGKGMARALPISATGDIESGRMMVEYALRGATSGQLHTFFQLPSEAWRLKGVPRVRAALHELFFHPRTGLVAAMLGAAELDGGGTRPIRFLDLPEVGRKHLLKLPTACATTAESAAEAPESPRP